MAAAVTAGAIAEPAHLTAVPALRAAATTGAEPRERILEAIVAVAARRGYAGASVARIIARAGVSRATFYQHFRSREDCFLAAHEHTLEQLRARVAGLPHQPSAGCLRNVVEVLLRLVAEHPDHARFLLVEARAGPPAVSRAHRRFVRAVEAWAESRRLLNVATASLPSEALHASLGGLITTRLLDGREAELPQLLTPFLAWVESYALPAPGGAPAWDDLRGQPGFRPSSSALRQPVRPLPRGASALPAGLAAERRRQRIIAATASLVAGRGYASLNVADIAAAARVSRRGFYSLFAGKEDAFLAAQAEALHGGIAASASAFSLAADWPDAVWRAGEAMLGYMAANPDLAHLGIVEVYTVGERAIRLNEDSRLAYGLFLDRGFAEYPAAAEHRELFAEAIAAAVFGLLRRQALSGGIAGMPSLLPQAAFVILAPFVGAEAALRFVTDRVRAARAARRAGPSRAHLLRARA